MLTLVFAQCCEEMEKTVSRMQSMNINQSIIHKGAPVERTCVGSTLIAVCAIDFSGGPRIAVNMHTMHDEMNIRSYSVPSHLQH